MIYDDHSFAETTWFGTLNKLVTAQLAQQFPPDTIIIDGSHLWDFDVESFKETNPPHFYVLCFSDPTEHARHILGRYFASTNYTILDQKSVPNYNFLGRYCYNIFYNNYKGKEFNSSLEYLYLCYNRKPHQHRILLSNAFEKRGLLNKGIYTLGEFRDANRAQIPYTPINTAPVSTFTSDVNTCPRDNPVKNVPNDITTLGNLDLWNKSFVNVVGETTLAYAYPTEKAFKPIIGKRPFIFNSAPGTLQLLRDWGFRTFDSFWDESYDNDPYTNSRIDKIADIILDLSQKSKAELEEMYKDMYYILEHNHSYFFNGYQKFNNDAFNSIGKNFT